MKMKLDFSENSMISNIFFLIPFLLLLTSSLVILTSCKSYNLKKKLDPEGKEFLSKVGYIITSEERKIFIKLPPSERKEFIEEFWKRRDPDPDTEFNEFKEQYYSRIEEANKLFQGVKPGWLQDRGRIYVLLGPPDQRITYPMGRGSRDSPHEIWYYGMFPIIFIDYSKAGDYELSPLSAQHIAEINKAQLSTQKIFRTEKVLFDFNLEIKRGLKNETLIHVEIPYENIWFVQKGDNLETTLELSIEILNSENKEVWQHKKEYKISITEEEVKGRGSYLIEVPVVLERGKYIINLILFNETGEEKLKKKIEVKI